MDRKLFVRILCTCTMGLKALYYTTILFIDRNEPICAHMQTHSSTNTRRSRSHTQINKMSLYTYNKIMDDMLLCEPVSRCHRCRHIHLHIITPFIFNKRHWVGMCDENPLSYEAFMHLMLTLKIILKISLYEGKMSRANGWNGMKA